MRPAKGAALARHMELEPAGRWEPRVQARPIGGPPPRGEKDSGVTEIGLTGTVWWQSSVNATGAIFYKARRGSAADDELVAYVDFGRAVRSQNGSFFLDRSAIELGSRL
jgi:hypothetical protein